MDRSTQLYNTVSLVTSFAMLPGTCRATVKSALPEIANEHSWASSVSGISGNQGMELEQPIYLSNI